MISLEFLENVQVFEDLNDDQLTRIQKHCREARFSRGDKIFSAGEKPQYLWVVMEGQVSLQWSPPGRAALPESTISRLSESMTFGWSSLVPPYSYRLSAYCATRTCRVMQVDRDALIQLFENDAELGYKVMLKLLSVVGSRFLNLQDEVAKQRGSDIINQW
ncbi:MAG: Crp/Fnr family transcriptional regulator [Deltaproteobacteria bacterium]|jgi:CRP-like cAMP-binding protein|nr:Crp/Fnr family transcriptional regulator [Deltaproteobacteria bacterium]